MKNRNLHPTGDAWMAARLCFAIALILFGAESLSAQDPKPEKDDAPPAAAGKELPPPDAARPMRLNFRGVALEMVLNHLSEAAGYIIVIEPEAKGKLDTKIDAWSNQAVSQEEALTILNSALSRAGCAAIRNGRTLTIVTKDEAKKRDLPVKSGSNPSEIPRNDDMVTQILPIRFINAAQLTKDLQPLVSEKATMTANESGNALVITDTQINIHRFAEIIRALDTSLSSASMVKVFALRFADAKQLSAVIRDLFPSTGTQAGGGGGGGRGGGGFGGFGGFGGGGGGFGGGAGGGGNAASTANTGGRPGASRVIASADEYSNSLIVSAPDDVMPTIEEMVKGVDTPVQDVTEVRVFRLKNSDPTEMSEMLANLFPDDTRTGDANNRQQVRFGGGPFGGNPFGQTAAAGANSERAKKKGRVLAVADPRTSSLVVSTSRDLMIQIAQMIEQLDASPAKRQRVFVYSLENADTKEVEQVLRGMFERTTTQNNRNNSQQDSVLTTRSTSSQATGVGSSRSSTGSGFGGTGGTGGGRNTP
ncbi:MAG: hypothetical protein HY299_03790 [Verrucomicrobia bacterium]|nr:hypothetical protein [Verrucomicrobiota bacterium]